MLWTEKYKPSNLNEVLQHPVNNLKELVLGIRKAVLIHGPTGVGKTVVAHALANELNHELYELNASNLRNKDQIISLLGASTQQRSLFSKGKIILIDELDGLSSVDRGAVKAIIEIIQNTKFPIILTTSSFDSDKLEPLKKYCYILEFEPLKPESISKKLTEICEKEKLHYDPIAITYLARYSSGDLRAAITDLQVLSNQKITKESVLELGTREKTEEIKNLLLKILKTKDISVAYEALSNKKLAINLIDYGKTNRSPVIFSDDNALLYWIEENVPRNYRITDLEKSFDLLSRVDIYQRQIMRSQHYRFLVYISALLSAGIANSKEHKPEKIILKKTRRSPKQNFRLWGLVSKRKYLIADKLSTMTRISTQRNLAELPYLKFLLKNNKILQGELEFEKQDIDYINKL